MIRYSQVIQDLSLIPDFIQQYESELERAKLEVKIKGNLERAMAELPGDTEYRFGQLQEIESVLKYIEEQIEIVTTKHFKKYLEGYARALSSKDAERYAENEQEVISLKLLANEVALLRNRFLGIMKALESKNFMLGHITKLRCIGLEDATL